MSTECFECGQDAVHRHHVIPRSLGGTKTIPLCLLCHSKAHKLPAGLSHPALTRSAMAHLKAQGRRVGSIPHGYRLGDENVLVADEREQEILRFVREWRANGWGLKTISDELAIRGMFNRFGRPFNPRSVRSMARVAS